MLRFLASFLFLASVATSAQALVGKNGVIFAAASLKGPLDKAVALLVREGRCVAPGATIRISYASSGILARQIQQGAPADLFISADRRWIDFLVARGRLRVEGLEKAVLLTNQLVVIAARSVARMTTLQPESAIAARLDTERFAMGDPAHVPAGRYARAALRKMGLWKRLQPKAILTANVRIALSYVARREASLGIVYRTDATADPRVQTIARFPAGSHPPIRYTGAVVTGSGVRCAGVWLKGLMGPDARRIFQTAGYGTPGAR